MIFNYFMKDMPLLIPITVRLEYCFQEVGNVVNNSNKCMFPSALFLVKMKTPKVPKLLQRVLCWQYFKIDGLAVPQAL